MFGNLQLEVAVLQEPAMDELSPEESLIYIDLVREHEAESTPVTALEVGKFKEQARQIAAHQRNQTPQ